MFSLINEKFDLPIVIEIMKRVTILVPANNSTPVPPIPSPSTTSTSQPVLPGNLKNDGSFLEQFKKAQQLQKTESPGKAGILYSAS